MAGLPLIKLRLPYESEEEFLAKLGPSLARNQIFVGTRSPKALGTVFAFLFVLKNGAKILGGEGKVESISADPARPGMTVAIRALDHDSQDLLALANGTRKSRPPAPAAAAAAAAQPATPPTDPAAEERKRRREAILSGASSPSQPPTKRSDAPILGIDLGTTNCRVAVWKGGGIKHLPLEGRNLNMPSVVAFDEKGRLLVGARAKAHVLVDPKSAIFGAKRLVGRRAGSRKVKEMASRFPYELAQDEHGDVAVKVQGKVISVPQVLSYLLHEIRDRASTELGCATVRAVIGVPAYFNDRQRQAVRYAGQLAGLEIVRVLSEPTAVAVAYGFGKGLTRKRLLVYDLGGGTLDASVLEATGDDLEVAGAGGDNFLGGLDFDARVSRWLEERFQATQGFALPVDPLSRQRVRDAAETAKIQLSERADARVMLPVIAQKDGEPVSLDASLDRAKLEALTADLVERSLAVTRVVLTASEIPPSAIDEVLLVGGQSQSPAVRAAVEGLIGKPAHRDLDPFASVAIGAALIGRALLDDPSAETFSLHVEEKLSLAVFARTLEGAFHRVLDAGSPLPCEKTVAFGGAKALEVAVYQGEKDDSPDLEFLGLARVPAGAQGELTFQLSADGMLSLFAGAPTQTRRPVALDSRAADPFALPEDGAATLPALAADDRKGGLLSRFFKK
ncbi:MAG TPA: Hsp70 family protein [Myxococcales bacterium]|jgi:molecular chaperone DnaK